MHSYHLKILEHHLDTFGHVNHATYLQIYEEARWDMLEQGDFGLQKIQQLQLGPVILGVNIQYRRELTLRTEIEIQTTTTEVRGKIGQIQQRMLSENRQVEHSHIELSYGIMDFKKRKLLAPPEMWLHAVQLTRTPT